MTANRSEYPAPLFDAIHRGNPGDVAFYQRACDGVDEVLEIGCGTGRVAGVLSDGGTSVFGFDLDRERVEIARKRGVRAEISDLRDFSLERRFERIIAPYNTLYCLLDEADLLACLKRVRAHLNPRGQFIFDGYAADAQHYGASEEEARAETVEFVGSAEFQGLVYDVLEHGRWDRATQVVEARYEHIPRGPGERIEAFLPQRYLLREQIDRIFTEAGLTPMSIWGDFSGGVHQPDSDHFVVCASPMP